MTHLFAHNAKNYVKKGDQVKAYGDWIGEIGNAGGQYYAHLHYSVSEGLTPNQIKSYVRGWSMDKIKKYYREPQIDRSKMFNKPVDNGQAGYNWLQAISKGYWHPGRDYNGFGGGNTDYGYKFKSPVNGVVVYSGDWGVGWGKCIIIEENEMKNQDFYDDRLNGQGWKTLEDWVGGALEYRTERDEAEEELKDIVDKYKELVKAQDKINKSHDLELTRQKNSLTTDFNVKLKDLQDKLYICNKLKDGAMDLADDSDCKETIKRLEDIIEERDTEINKLDLEIVELKKSESILNGALRIISNFLKRWKD